MINVIWEVIVFNMAIMIKYPDSFRLVIVTLSSFSPSIIHDMQPHSLSPYLLFFLSRPPLYTMSAASFSPEIMAKIKEVTAKNYVDQAIFYLNAFVCFSFSFHRNCFIQLIVSVILLISSIMV